MTKSVGLQIDFTAIWKRWRQKRFVIKTKLCVTGRDRYYADMCNHIKAGKGNYEIAKVKLLA